MYNPIKAITQFIENFGLRFRSNDENIFFYFSTEKSQFKVHIYTTFDDQVLSFDAREIIPTEEIQDSDHPAAFAVYLLQENWRTAAGSYEMDRDGEVRATVELPLADAQVTPNQVRLIINILAIMVDKVVEEGREVLKTGKLPSPQTESESGPMAELQQMVEMHQKLSKLKATADGRAKLAQLANDANMPAMVRSIAQHLLGETAPDEL